MTDPSDRDPRDAFLVTRFREQELELVRYVAGLAGLPTSTYVREVVLSGIMRHLERAADMTQADGLIAEVGGTVQA
jgi:hypothetical protein